ncbi:Serine/threonine-protein kinase gad8 [Smittium culicis]|uniref:non-specific serine/threonine protein kinase n=1 Tax=Smittium culicis TaxID=133412 RepID=A0A1R1XQU7_9FUNG|nr:Serine/threonine-protein kinase gad8 [Smittium culicis]
MSWLRPSKYSPVYTKYPVSILTNLPYLSRSLPPPPSLLYSIPSQTTNLIYPIFFINLIPSYFCLTIEQKKNAKPETDKSSKDALSDDFSAKALLKNNNSPQLENNLKNLSLDQHKQNAVPQPAIAKPLSSPRNAPPNLDVQHQTATRSDPATQNQVRAQNSPHLTDSSENLDSERRVGILTVKIICGKSVITPNRAQFIASHYTKYKNDVQQRPFAVISFDKNEVIAAPLGGDMINPVWEYRANFDVSRKSDVTVSLYQQIEQNIPPGQAAGRTQGSGKCFITVFLGKTKFTPIFNDRLIDEWYQLDVSGYIHLQYSFNMKETEKLNIDQFDLLKVIGRGSFGKVFQVRKRDTGRIYAMKVLSKSKIIMRSEVAHTLAERNVLAKINHPFIVPLKFSFQTPEKLYLVLAFINGGELFHHLHREGKFDQHLSRFYAAELLCALECLHSYDVVYRDLKPENILLDYSGHVALCDFGLCKLNMTDEQKTNTFCGTPEYLAPELLLGHGYTRTVDWWTFGILLYEMLTGLPPFYCENPNEMYRRVLEEKLTFPPGMGSRAKALIKGLLVRDPEYRLGSNGATEIKSQQFFAEIDWDLLLGKKYDPPFKPLVNSAFDTSNFEDEFTTELPEDSYIPDSNLSETVQQQFSGFSYDGSGGAFSLAQSYMINNNNIADDLNNNKY